MILNYFILGDICEFPVVLEEKINRYQLISSMLLNTRIMTLKISYLINLQKLQEKIQIIGNLILKCSKE